MDVFISYSSQDQTIAAAACAAIESTGYRCWIAPRNIRPGTDWSAAIIEGIESSRLFVLVYSQHANASRQVLREVERAVAKGLPIIPFRVENVAPAKGLEYFISSQHWLDATSPPLKKHLERLAKTIRDLLGAAPAAPPNSPPAQSEAAPPLRVKWNRRLTIGVAAIVLIAAVAGIWAIFAARPGAAAVPSVDPSLAPKGAPAEPTAATASHDPLYAHAVHERFSRWDANHDGQLTMFELRAGLARIPGSNEALARNLRLADQDRDDLLTEDELLNFARCVMKDIDADGDGRHTLEEQWKRLRAVGGQASLKEVSEVFRKSDTDRDGYVSQDEMERYFGKLLSSRP